MRPGSRSTLPQPPLTPPTLPPPTLTPPTRTGSDAHRLRRSLTPTALETVEELTRRTGLHESAESRVDRPTRRRQTSQPSPRTHRLHTKTRPGSPCTETVSVTRLARVRHTGHRRSRAACSPPCSATEGVADPPRSGIARLTGTGDRPARVAARSRARRGRPWLASRSTGHRRTAVVPRGRRPGPPRTRSPRRHAG